MSEKAIKTPIPEATWGGHYIGREEIDAVTKLLQDPYKLFRYRGDEKTQCALVEEEAMAFTGAKHALFLNSGTSALVCCLAGFRIGPGDEVIIPGYTYIATASAVMDVGAVPVIADIDDSLGLDPADVERKITPYTKAIIAVHMRGNPCRIAQLRAIAKKHNVKLIEDVCQAIGATYFGVPVGVESDAFAWSLNYFKVITCGEGGMFFTNDSTAFQNGLFQSDPAMLMWDSSFDLSDENKPFSRGGYRGNEILAAILRVQLGRLEGILKKNRANRKTLVGHLNKPINYKLQHVDDPEGDLGISFGIIAHNKELAKRLSEEIGKEGLTISSSYTGEFPDRHVYVNWNSLLNKFGATDLGYPWKDPAYKGKVEYSADMCPGVLDFLARALKMTINAEMTEQNMIEIADAINKADARV